MEFLLLWWDELDDLTHACRHLASAAFSEVAAPSMPLVAGLTSTIAWIALRAQTWAA
jgi:hypothetical protein